MKNNNQSKTFERHFRVYFVNGHPAYIVDENDNEYYFHRTTHSKTSGGRDNWPKENPINDGDERTMYIVKKEQHDRKGRFSLFCCEIKNGMDISYPEIKKAGSTQASDCRTEVQTSKIIKTNQNPKSNKKVGKVYDFRKNKPRCKNANRTQRVKQHMRIKKTGGSRTNVVNNVTTSKNIKSRQHLEHKKKTQYVASLKNMQLSHINNRKKRSKQ